jgi:hypothetical protein
VKFYGSAGGLCYRAGRWPAIGYPSACLGPLGLGGPLQDGGYFRALQESFVHVLSFVDILMKGYLNHI